MFCTGRKIRPACRQKNFKHRVVQAAAATFCLSKFEMERLANSAGFSFFTDEDFSVYFQTCLKKSGRFYRQICAEAGVSERMFYHIKSGRKPTKITLLALAAALEMNISETQNLLQKAGYVLSKSIAFDMVVKWLIRHSCCKRKRTRPLLYINNVLYSLRLPLLAGREKSPN